MNRYPSAFDTVAAYVRIPAPSAQLYNAKEYQNSGSASLLLVLLSMLVGVFVR